MLSCCQHAVRRRALSSAAAVSLSNNCSSSSIAVTTVLPSAASACRTFSLAFEASREKNPTDITFGETPKVNALAATSELFARNPPHGWDPKCWPPPPIEWTTHRLSKESILKVDKLFHKLLWLDMIEMNWLTMIVNKRLGIFKLTPKQDKDLTRQLWAYEAKRIKRIQGDEGAGDDDAGAPAVADAPAPVKLVELKLVGYDEKSKVKVIKEVRAAVPSLGLKEAKELVESAPKSILKDLKPEVAEELVKKLEAAGAKIEVV